MTSDFGKLSLLGRTDRVNQLGFISLADGRNNAYIGLYAGASRPQLGKDNLFAGTYAGSNAVADSSVFLGTAAGRKAARTKETCFIGYKAGELAERVESTICVGAYAGRKMKRANCNTLLGYQAGTELTSGSRNTILGAYAAFSQYNAHDNVCIGHRAGYKNTVGSNNCYIGTNSGFAAFQGYDNVALGVRSGEGLTQGRKNVLIGYSAGANISGASNCIAIGTQAMEFFFDGDTNTCVGTQAAKTFTGYNNTILGGYCTSNASGNYNTIVGSRSMNRRSGDKVALSNCVILGENIQFDIPVRIETAYAKDMDIIPDSQIENKNEDTLLLSTPSRVFAALNLVPVGDPMLVKERYISLGTFDTPVIFDTLNTGIYTVRWGSDVTDTNELLEPIPVQTTIDVNSSTILVSLEVYGEFVQRWSLPTSETLKVHLAQAFDPPAIRVVLETDPENSVDDTIDDLQLPGIRFDVQRVPTYEDDFLTLYATTNTDALVPGMEIQITDSTIDALNTVWRIAEVKPAEDDVVPFVLDITGAEGVQGSDLGPKIRVLGSKVVTRPIFGDVLDGVLSLSEPFFAGMLKDTLTPCKVFVDGSGDLEEGVYDAILGDTPGDFQLELQLDDGNYFAGNVSIGTFESLIVGFEIATSSDISGPSGIDGHVQSGAGSQSQMDAGLDDGYLAFAGNGEYEYATYELQETQGNVIDITGAFQIPLSGDIDFGFKWLGHYDVKCFKQNNNVAVSITSTNDNIVTDIMRFATDVQVTGSIETASFPIDITQLLQTPDPRMTVSVKHELVTQKLVFVIVLQGGVRYPNLFVPRGPEYKATIRVDYVPAATNPTNTIVYYANAPTKLTTVAIATDVESYDISTLDQYSVTYSQRSDTGIQSTTIEGPTAFDGHKHVGEGTQEDMDQDIRDNILTFSDLGKSAAKYTIGLLSTKLAASVDFQWAPTQFGIEYLQSYQLLCTPSGNGLDIMVYHELSDTILAKFTPDELYGRVRARIVRLDENDEQIPLIYPYDVEELEPQTVTIAFDHQIKPKQFTLTVTVRGVSDKIVYTIQIVDAPPVKRSDVLSFVAYGETTATNIRITQTTYKAYPTFEDCIFVGSNFTVGGDIDTVDQERANVFIAAIGDTRLFRGKTEEFVFFSNVVIANALTLEGGTGDTPTLVIAGNATGDALSVTGNVAFEGDFDVDGAVSCTSLVVREDAEIQQNLKVTGTTTLEDTLQVTGAVTLEAELDVAGASTFADDVTISTNATIEGDLSVGGTTTLDAELQVNADAQFDESVTIKGGLTVEEGVDVEQDLNVLGNVDMTNNLDVGDTVTTSNLAVTDIAEIEILVVAGNTTLSDTLIEGSLDFSDATVSGDIILTNKDEETNISVRGLRGDLDGLGEDFTTFESDVGNTFEDIGNAITALENTRVTGDDLDAALEDYLPLSAGSQNPLTGGLFCQNSILTGGRLYVGTLDAGSYSGGAEVYCAGSILASNVVYGSNKVVAGRTIYDGGATLFSDGSAVVTGKLYVGVAGFVPTGARVYVSGTIASDGDKTFDIQHPLLPSKRLVHACLEGPRCDLVYRGTARLNNGTATVNIDAECSRGTGMTSGTYEMMAINPSVFLQSTEFDKVKGSVDGGTLHIVSENPDATHDVSWMIVAERNDAYMRQAYPDGIFQPEK